MRKNTSSVQKLLFMQKVMMLVITSGLILTEWGKTMTLIDSELPATSIQNANPQRHNPTPNATPARRTTTAAHTRRPGLHPMQNCRSLRQKGTIQRCKVDHPWCDVVWLHRMALITHHKLLLISSPLWERSPRARGTHGRKKWAAPRSSWHAWEFPLSLGRRGREAAGKVGRAERAQHLFQQRTDYVVVRAS